MSTSEQHLKSCPFCGETRHLVTVGSNDADGASRWTVHCQSWEDGGCLCHGPVAKTEKEAAKLWNERVESSLTTEAHVFGDVNGENYTLRACPFCGETTNLAIVCAVSFEESYWAVYCQSWSANGCLCHGPSAKSERDAVKLWNERVEEQ